MARQDYPPTGDAFFCFGAGMAEGPRFVPYRPFDANALLPPRRSSAHASDEVRASFGSL
jgi:hypothetical protein